MKVNKLSVVLETFSVDFGESGDALGDGESDCEYLQPIGTPGYRMGVGRDRSALKGPGNAVSRAMPDAGRDGRRLLCAAPFAA